APLLAAPWRAVSLAVPPDGDIAGSPFGRPPRSLKRPRILQKRPERLSAVADGVLLRARQLGERTRARRGIEDGVVPEPARPPRLVRDQALGDTAERLDEGAGLGEREGADEAGAPLLPGDALELFEQEADTLFVVQP